MPSLRQKAPDARPDAKMVAAPLPAQSGADLAAMAMYGFGAIPTIGSAVSVGNRSKDDGVNPCFVVAMSDPEAERPLKKRLRPRRSRN